MMSGERDGAKIPSGEDGEGGLKAKKESYSS